MFGARKLQTLGYFCHLLSGKFAKMQAIKLHQKGLQMMFFASKVVIIDQKWSNLARNRLKRAKNILFGLRITPVFGQKSNGVGGMPPPHLQKKSATLGVFDGFPKLFLR